MDITDAIVITFSCLIPVLAAYFILGEKVSYGIGIAFTLGIVGIMVNTWIALILAVFFVLDVYLISSFGDIWDMSLSFVYFNFMVFELTFLLTFLLTFFTLGFWAAVLFAIVLGGIAAFGYYKFEQYRKEKEMRKRYPPPSLSLPKDHGTYMIG
jgi:hypothetical protein